MAWSPGLKTNSRQQKAHWIGEASPCGNAEAESEAESQNIGRIGAGKSGDVERTSLTPQVGRRDV